MADIQIISETPINIFPLLKEQLLQKIADVEINAYFVPFIDDIPAKANLLSNSDVIFVFVLYEEKDFRSEMLLSKLIDLEIHKNVKIIKAIEEADIPEDDDAMENFKEELAEKWAGFIINYIYHPKEFEPKDEEPSFF